VGAANLDAREISSIDKDTGTERTGLSVPVSAGRTTKGLESYLIPITVVALAFVLRLYLLPSIPFGWHLDEATKGLLARDVVLAGKQYPAFFSAFTGREALYIYLEATAFALLGDTIFSGRVLSAFVGVLTVAVTYTTGRVVFNRRTGLLAAGFLAISLWHLIASRNGYRAVIQPLIQLPVVWLLFREWRAAPGGDGGRWRLVVAGIFLGLTQYTYTAARAFPVFVLGLIVLARILSPRLVNRRWASLALMFFGAAVALVPLGIHFIQHPEDLNQRTAQISVFAPEWAGGDSWGRLWQSVKETVRMFTRWGDPNYRFNLAGRPVFGVVDGALFYGGLLFCLWGVVRERGLRRVACAVLLLWLGVMLLPMTLSAEGLPYYQRAIGILPAMYFFPALPLHALAGWVERKAGPRLRAVRVLCGLSLVLLLVCLGARTCREYFVAWHTATRNDDDRRVAMVYVADYLEEVAPEGELYLSTEYAQHPTLAFLAPEQYDGIHWFDARQSLPLPPAGVEATHLMLTENAPQPALMRLVPDLRRVHTGFDRFGRPVFEVYHWEDGELPVPSDQSPATWSWEVAFVPGDPGGLRHSIDLPVDFGGVMRFVGHDRSSGMVSPGETVELVLHWRLLEKPTRNYSIFAHLLDRESQIVGESDANWYAADFWWEGGGETLLSYFPLQVKPDTPPGEYQLEIGVYHQESGERLPVCDNGEMVADRLLLRPVEVK
jgi:4-amino-4-deoxy-L-arabinose transferase-like glycosyltransferase